jgi:hypothetical protein
LSEVAAVEAFVGGEHFNKVADIVGDDVVELPTEATQPLPVAIATGVTVLPQTWSDLGPHEAHLGDE